MCHSNQALAKSSAGIGLPGYLSGAYHASRGFFMRVAQLHPVMVGWAGVRKDAGTT
ncbi:ash family protein [Enterobacter hormaechei]|nr:ash family protein [Enterobacter hormaechei]MBI9030006.1 ash family protein [Enterobacter hormaechei]